MTIIIGGLILIAVIVIAANKMDREEPPAQIAPATSIGPTAASLATQAEGCATFYCGEIQAEINNFDALDPSTTRTEGTNMNTVWWRNIDNKWVRQAGGDAVVFGIDVRDRGMVWSSHEAPTAQAFYLDVEQTSTVNNRFEEYRYYDIDKDGTKEHVFRWSVADLNPLSGGQTAKQFFVNAAWFTAGTPSFPTAGQAADITGIGTTAGTVIFKPWHIVLDQDTAASMLYEVEFRINTTSTSKWDRGQSWIDLSEITSGRVGQLSLAEMMESQDGTNTIYKRTFSNHFKDDLPFKVPAQAENREDTTVKMVWNLTTSDVLTTTLYYRFHTSSLGTIEISDTSINSAA